jgi:hypothetical protein
MIPTPEATSLCNDVRGPGVKRMNSTGFAEKPLSSLTEADLQQLVLIKAPEGLMLEFKRELDLSSNAQKHEAAKDASALANTVGGRILYGVNETKLSDGSVVAGRITPLSDGTVAARLSDVLNTTVHPRLRFDTHQIPISSAGAGHVLALEVYPASQLDLHMVTGYGDNRFYRRGPSGVVPMTEPEIREAYYRISESRGSLDARVRALTAQELVGKVLPPESIMVIPLFSRPGLIDPRQVGDLSARLTSVLAGSELQHIFNRLELGFDGYRLMMGGGAVGEPQMRLAVLKNGVTHFARNISFVSTGTEWYYVTSRAAYNILQTLVIASEVLAMGHYWGPVRVLYEIRPPKPWRVDAEMFPGDNPIILPGTYGGEVSEVNLQQTRGAWDRVVVDLLDPIAHAAGRETASVGGTDGLQVPAGMKRDLAPLRTVARITFGS